MQKILRVTCLAAIFQMSIAAPFAGTACGQEKAKKAESAKKADTVKKADTAKKGGFDFAKTSSFMREMETRPDFPVSIVLANDYVYSLLAIGDKIDTGRQNAVIAYIKLSQQKNGGFVSGKGDTGASVLYTDIALETLGYLDAPNAIDAGRVQSFVASLKNADGGFGFSQESKKSSLANTYYAVRILKSLGALDSVDKEKTAKYVKGFEKKSGGFGYVKDAGIANARNTYMATYVLNALGKLDEATRKNTVNFMATTRYVDKKNTERPELDEQMYALKALKELKAGDKIDKKRAQAFMKKIYIAVNGGFGPEEGLGSTPDTTTNGLRVLVETGKLKAPSTYALVKK